MIKAEIIADSLNEHGQRLTTFVLCFPRIVLAEFNTHRMLSKNSASSRAIPFKTMIEKVRNEPFIPIRWMKEHKGMQGSEYFTDDEEFELGLRKSWLDASTEAAFHADRLSRKGVTKQICNRLLEPFLYHTCICTGTGWENFFALRAHDQAEIHIQELAYKMLETYNNSTPRQLTAGKWHVPFGDKITNVKMNEQFGRIIKREEGLQLAIKIATARCARVSYLNFEGKDDYEADIRLHDMLLNSGHFSPTEHCAMAMDNSDWYGNFQGFKQYRKFLPNECRKDSRVLAK